MLLAGVGWGCIDVLQCNGTLYHNVSPAFTGGVHEQTGTKLIVWHFARVAAPYPERLVFRPNEWRGVELLVQVQVVWS